jgi:hypothetical protein
MEESSQLSSMTSEMACAKTLAACQHMMAPFSRSVRLRRCGSKYFDPP